MRWVLYILVGFYGIAVLMLMIGNYGWFGQQPDPLSGVFLLPLGLPWNILADRYVMAKGPIVAIGAPLINIAILYALIRALRTN